MKQRHYFFIRRSTGQWINHRVPRSPEANTALLVSHAPLQWERICVLADDKESAKKMAINLRDRQNRLTAAQQDLLDTIFSSLRPSIKINTHDPEGLKAYIKLQPHHVSIARGLVNRSLLEYPYKNDTTRVRLTIMGLNHHPLLPKTPNWSLSARAEQAG